MVHKLNQTFYYQYSSIDETASIYISVPFKVDSIIIKSITYKRGYYVAGNSETYVTFISSLVGNKPVGMVYRDNRFSMNTIQDIEHTFQIPQVINGNYDFVPYFNDGTKAPTFEVVFGVPPVTYYDSFSITLEFLGK